MTSFVRLTINRYSKVRIIVPLQTADSFNLRISCPREMNAGVLMSWCVYKRTSTQGAMQFKRLIVLLCDRRKLNLGRWKDRQQCMIYHRTTREYMAYGCRTCLLIAGNILSGRKGLSICKFEHPVALSAYWLVYMYQCTSKMLYSTLTWLTACWTRILQRKIPGVPVKCQCSFCPKQWRTCSYIHAIKL